MSMADGTSCLIPRISESEGEENDFERSGESNAEL